MKKILVLCGVVLIVSLLVLSVIGYGQKAISVRLAPDVSLNPMLQQFDAQPELQAPDDDAPDVLYEFELALDPSTGAGGYFAEPLVSLVGSNALVDTTWKCDIVLEYETRYYWHVKAIGVGTESPWSDIGTFTTIAPPHPHINPRLVAVIVVVAVVGILFISKQVIRSLRRRNWQKKAEEKPKEPCNPGDPGYQKIESKCELTRCQVKHLTLLAHDAGPGKSVKEKQLKGEIVDRLNRIIAASRRGEPSEKLKEQAAPLAGKLLQLILDWLIPEPVPRDVSIIVHLEGCKVTYKFQIKHCQETGKWGDPEQEWKATIKEERDEPLSFLPDLGPGAGILEQLTAELTRQLMQLVEKV